MSRGAVVGVVLLAAWAAACGEENPGGQKGKLAGANACENFAALASNHSCEQPESCSVPAECEAAAEAFVQCAATDDAQCYCEKSGGLNCEGAWKPDEGPARCIAEHDAMEACDG